MSLRSVSGVALAALLLAPLTVHASTRITRNDIGLGEFFGLASFTDAEDPLVKTPVTYDTVGMNKYDTFFRDSAVVHATMLVATAYTTANTKNLKKSAMSFAAANASDASVKEIVGTTKEADLTPDQQIALLKLKKKKGQLSDDEKKYMAKTGASFVSLAATLAQTGLKAAELVKTGQELSQSVKSDFTGFNMMKAPGVTASLGSAGGNLKDAGVATPPLVKETTVLGEGLIALSAA